MSRVEYSLIKYTVVSGGLLRKLVCQSMQIQRSYIVNSIVSAKVILDYPISFSVVISGRQVEIILGVVENLKQ